MQAITVKYLPATNKLPGRYRAQSAAGYVYVSQQVENFNADQHARMACVKLAKKFNWKGAFYQGMLANGSYVFVQKQKVQSPDFTVF